MAKQTKAQLEARVAELEEQLVHVKQKFEKYVLGGVKLTSAGPSADGKGFELRLSDARGIVQMMADALVTCFEGDGGINYVEYEMRHIERNEYFILSIQRKAGKKPSQLKNEAEEYATAVQAMLNKLVGPHECSYPQGSNMCERCGTRVFTSAT